MKKLICFMIAMLFAFVVISQDETSDSRQLTKAEKHAAQMEKISSLIESETLVFYARKAEPLADECVYLSHDYFVQLNGRQIISYLPYQTALNEEFTADLTMEDSPFNFTGVAGNLNIEEDDGRYLISFQVNNNADVVHYFLRVSELGHAHLKVSSSQRECIGFHGMVDEVEPIFSQN